MSDNWILKISSWIRGFHVYKDWWTPTCGEILPLQPELGNAEDKNAVAVLKKGRVVDHIPFHLADTKNRTGIFTHYSGSAKRKARVRKCNRFPCQKGGHGPRRFMRRLRKLGMRIRQLVLSMLWPNALDIRNSSEIILCFVMNVLKRFMFSTLMSQRNAHAVRGRATVNDVERFRNGSLIHEFY